MNAENMYDAWDNGDRHEIRQQLAKRNKKDMTDREAMQRALEALDWAADCIEPRKPKDCDCPVCVASTALRERLAQPEQEIDWKDQYEKQKRRAEMWRDKYEAIAGPDECVYPAQPEQEPVAHVTVAGALFDFMGWLTSRKERLVLSSSAEASPAVEAIQEFAKMRGLSLADADVQNWQQALAAPQPRQWVGLSTNEIYDMYNEPRSDAEMVEFARAIEAKLKEKNNG
jgi:hypothetical protein